MRYALVIEKGERNFAAHVPDSVGDTLDGVKVEIRQAIEFHLEGMREDGSPIPKPANWAEYVEVGDDPYSIHDSLGNAARRSRRRLKPLD
jgi:predicted RNase H-like HicB family nuclease